MQLPEGYGYQYEPTDNWMINYMIHNLTTKPDKVWITYDLDFIPADSPAAANIKAARPIWMDVQNGSVYPVFDVLKGSGTNGRLHLPGRRDGPVRRPARRRTSGPSTATACCSRPPATSTRAASTTTSTCSAPGATALKGHDKPGQPDTAHLFRSDGALLRAGRRRVVGRGDDRAPSRTGGSR